MLITTLALGFALLQNPLPHDLRLPDGWKVGRGINDRKSRSSVIGPDGETISFPDYSPTGKVAAVLHEMDRRSTSIWAKIDGVFVEATLDTDGMLALSYPSHPESDPRYFDYWSHVKTARQTTQTILIMLTRLDVRRRDRPAASKTEYSLQDPFGVFRVRNQVELTRGPILEFDLGENGRVRLGHELPTKLQWTDRATLLGQEIRVVGSANGTVSVFIVGKGKPDVFSSANATPGAAAVALFAAICYLNPPT